MKVGRASPLFAYALVLTSIVSVFSIVPSVKHADATHANIILNEANISLEYGQSDDITIEGEIDDVNNDVDEVTLSITGPSLNYYDEVDHDDGEFEFEYSLENDAEDGIYVIEVEYDDESVFSYFMVDEDDDDVDVELDSDTFDEGDTVEISGSNIDVTTGEDEVDITIEDPEGDDGFSTDTELDGDEYSAEVDLDDAVHGKYAVTVTYDDEEGYAVFEVDDGGSSSGSGDITASITDSTLAPGEEVRITGSIDEDDIEGNSEVILVVEDPDGDEVSAYEDSVEPDTNGDFDFNFDLEDDADIGIYTIVLSYELLDDKELTFTVSTSSGGSGGSGGSSGSDDGLTARLSKSSYLAGEELVVSGVVPSISSDDDGVSITISTPANFPIATRFPEPESSRSYSASIFLPQSLAEDEDYRVVVNYDGREVELSFDITGKTTGGTGGPITVKTDKASYSIGSTVIISGEVSDALLVDGQQITLQVFNPASAAYRFDPITPKDDGTYSYSMPVGGPLGVSGEWDVRVTYGGQIAETTFDLTGGVTAPPTYQLKFEDRTFPIEYTSDGTVNSMYLRPAEKKLVVSIEDDAEGKLTITLPREVIDAANAGADIKFIVTTIDTETGEEAQIDITESVTNADERTIVIDYDEGTDLIEIQGTNVVPEFGVLSAIVLAIAVLSIIVVTARFNKFSAFRQW